MQVIEHFDGAKGSIVSMPRITVGQLADVAARQIAPGKAKHAGISLCLLRPIRPFTQKPFQNRHPRVSVICKAFEFQLYSPRVSRGFLAKFTVRNNLTST